MRPICVLAPTTLGARLGRRQSANRARRGTRTAHIAKKCSRLERSNSVARALASGPQRSPSTATGRAWDCAPEAEMSSRSHVGLPDFGPCSQSSRGSRDVFTGGGRSRKTPVLKEAWTVLPVPRVAVPGSAPSSPRAGLGAGTSSLRCPRASHRVPSRAPSRTPEASRWPGRA
jgi:hypothetical protein